MSNVYCSVCGAQATSGSKFCPECGSGIPVIQSEQTNPMPQAVDQLHAAAAEQPPQQIKPVAAHSSQQTATAVQYPTQAVAPGTAPMSVFAYVITMLAFSLPIIGIVLAFVWAFNKNIRQPRRTFARAQLIIWLLFVVLAVLAFAFGGELVIEYGQGVLG